MRGLPIWMLTLLAVLTALLLVGGWHDRHEAGILPFFLGIAFALLWTVWMGWSSGSHGVAQIVILTVCGAVAGYLWYLGMRWRKA